MSPLNGPTPFKYSIGLFNMEAMLLISGRYNKVQLFLKKFEDS